MKFVNFNQYKKMVGNTLKSRLGVDISDVDLESIKDSYQHGWTPSEHVDLIASTLKAAS